MEEAVEKLEKRASDAAYCGHCGSDCSCGDDAAKVMRAEARTLQSYSWPSGDDFARSLDQTQEKILEALSL